jgi:hypothetical protein
VVLTTSRDSNKFKDETAALAKILRQLCRDKVMLPKRFLKKALKFCAETPETRQVKKLLVANYKLGLTV